MLMSTRPTSTIYEPAGLPASICYKKFEPTLYKTNPTTHAGMLTTLTIQRGMDLRSCRTCAARHARTDAKSALLSPPR